MPYILTIENVVLSKALYSICVCLSFNLLGAHAVVPPTALAKQFGSHGTYRVYMTGQGLDVIFCILSIILLDVFLPDPNLGFNGLSYLYSGACVIAIVVLKFYQFKQVWIIENLLAVKIPTQVFK